MAVNEPVDFDVEAEDLSQAADDSFSIASGVPNGRVVPDYFALDSDGIYLGFGAECITNFDEGIRHAPKAGVRGTKIATWRAHGGQATLVIRWVAQKAGGKPRPPAPGSLATNCVLIAKAFAQPTPPMGAGGDPVYTIAGIYTYALQVIPGDNDELPVVVAPTITLPASSTTLRVSDFATGLIQVANPSQGGSITAFTG